MNLNNDESKQQEVVKSYDEAKDSFSSYSKVLDFQNIDRIKESNNFASFYALNKLSNRFENRASVNSNQQSLHILQKYKRQRIVRKTLFFLYMIMTVFQRPGWCNFEDYQDYCTVHPDYKIPTIINFYLPINLFYCVEILIVLYLSFSKAIKNSILGNDIWKKISIALICTASVIMINDVIVMATENNYNYNISLLMKPIFVVLYKSQLQSIILNYCKIINKGKEIYYLMIFSLLFFAGLGSAIFQEQDQEHSSSHICKIDQPPFSQPEKCIVIILFVLQTTVNSPDIYLPYYEQSRPYVFYFIAFQFINTALIINFVLAFFYSSYKELMEEQTNQILTLHNQRLSRIAQKFFRKRTMSDITQITEIDTLENEIQLAIYKLLDNKYYEAFIEILCLISFFSIFIKINKIKLYILLSINAVLLIESLVLMYFNGSRKIFKKKTLLFELIISTLIIILIIVNIVDQFYLKYLLVLLCYRLLRGCKWLLQNEKFTKLIISISQIFSFIVQLFGTLFILFMLFTAIGQLLFGGKINYSNSNSSHYELANFNDFLSGMCTCWFLLIINNWNVISYNYAQIFNTDFVYFFFISFYIIVVLFALNVTMALLIEYIVQQINHKKQENSLEPQDEIHYDLH